MKRRPWHGDAAAATAAPSKLQPPVSSACMRPSSPRRGGCAAAWQTRWRRCCWRSASVARLPCRGGAEDAALRQQERVPGRARHAAGTPVEQTAAVLQTWARSGAAPEVPTGRATPAPPPDHLQRPGAPVLPARRPSRATCRSTWSTSTPPRAEPRHRAARCAGAGGHRRQRRRVKGGGGAARPAGAVAARGRGLRPRIGPAPAGEAVRAAFGETGHIVGGRQTRSSPMRAPPVLRIDRQRPPPLGVPGGPSSRRGARRLSGA